MQEKFFSESPTSDILVVLGAGAFGLAIALALDRAQKEREKDAERKESINKTVKVVLLPKFEAEYQELVQHRMLLRLPHMKIPPSIHIGPCYESKECRSLLKQAKIIFWVIPSKFSLDVARTLSCDISHTPLVICSKGLVQDPISRQILTLSQALEKVIFSPVCVLSGPNFAKEVASGLYTESILSGEDPDLTSSVAQVLSSSSFHVSSTSHKIGAQICGAAKNVLAIACGLLSKQEGKNTQAALLVKGLHEIGRICEACHVSSDVLLTLCGLGDVILTCSSDNSRNTSFGLALGRGENIDMLLQNKEQVVEGYFAAKQIHELTKQNNIRTPIFEAVYEILYKKASPVETLMNALRDNSLD